MCIANAGQVLGTFTGAVEGVIIDKERGRGGFGYDRFSCPKGTARLWRAFARDQKPAQSPGAGFGCGARVFDKIR
jgi:inosine/xanthosine triphosphate pyrophosphatase family protein